MSKIKIGTFFNILNKCFVVVFFIPIMFFEISCINKKQEIRGLNDETSLIKVQIVKENKEFPNLVFYYIYSKKPNDFAKIAKKFRVLEIENESLIKQQLDYSRWQISFYKTKPNFFVIGFFIIEDFRFKDDSLNIISKRLLDQSQIKLYSKNKDIFDTIILKKHNELELNYSDVNFDLRDTNWVGIDLFKIKDDF